MAHSAHTEIEGPVHQNDCDHKSDEYIGSILVFEIQDDGCVRQTPVDVYVHGNNECLCIRYGRHGDYVGTTIRSVVGYSPQCPLTKQALHWLSTRGHFAFRRTKSEDEHPIPVLSHDIDVTVEWEECYSFESQNKKRSMSLDSLAQRWLTLAYQDESDCSAANVRVTTNVEAVKGQEVTA